jgi:hypothetical protein
LEYDNSLILPITNYAISNKKKIETSKSSGVTPSKTTDWMTANCIS